MRLWEGSNQYLIEPVKILAQELKELRHKSLPLVKVIWQKHGTEEATWETEESMKSNPIYSHVKMSGMKFPIGVEL
ncbi:Chromo domain-containing protein [Gossypium australe]|uniref:Chromo domain-containing protein n=1 Tax=Gossypium australe TaxID=47621 RepID=A0A5B6X261_9ROSI|nr:Chromo domain-containing protein [Gossypium australe]